VGQLLNLIGFGPGIVLYAMMPARVIHTTHTSVTSTRLELLLLATAVLAWVRSLRSLTAHDRQTIRHIDPVRPLTAAGDSGLGGPSTVDLHSVLGRQESR
jgi:hypothetical protein